MDKPFRIYLYYGCKGDLQPFRIDMLNLTFGLSRSIFQRMFKDRLNPVPLAIIQEDQASTEKRRSRDWMRLGPVQYKERPVIDFGDPNTPLGRSRIVVVDYTYPFSGADEFAEQGTRKEIFVPKILLRKAMSGLRPGQRGRPVTREGYYRKYDWNKDQKQVGDWEKTEIRRVAVTLQMEMPLEGTSVVVNLESKPKRKLSQRRSHKDYFGRIEPTQMVFKSHHRFPRRAA